MTGTTFTTGVSTRKTYASTTAATDNSNLAATTKFINRTAVIRCTSTGTGETQTNFTLPDSAIVNDVILNVITLDAGETVDVGTMGTSNDPDGYLDGASLTLAGLVPAATVVTVGSNETFIASSTKGALLANIIVGTDLNLDTGNYVPVTNVSAGGDPISFTASAAGAVFDIIIDYVEVVSEAN